MPLTEDTIVWITDFIGLTLEQYKENYSIKAVKKFKSQGQNKIGYDWTFPQEYDPSSKSWKPKAKAVPASIYLGDRERAIDALHSFLVALGAPEAEEASSEEPPF